MEYAGYLPGLCADDVQWHRLDFKRVRPGLQVAVPSLSEAQLAALSTRVRAAGRRHLKTISTGDIMDIIDAAIVRLLDRDSPQRHKAEKLLPLVTGYDAEMVRLGLSDYFRTFRRPQLERFLAEDFADPRCLDGFQAARKGGFTRAYGPDLLFHSWAGNVPALSLWSLVCALLVKAPSIGKVASAEPLFAGWFAQLVADIEPALAECIGIVWWQGGDTLSENVVLNQADAVLAYGGNDALAAIRARTPITTRCLTYGHKISFGAVSRSALDSQQAWAVAHAAANDVMRYDQQGCYSPQLFFVERGGRVSPQEFTRYLAAELANFERKFPRHELDINEASGVATWKTAQEMRGYADPSVEFISDPRGAWSAIYVDSIEDLSASSLNRNIKIVGVDDLADVVAHVAPFKALLQTVGVAASPEELFRLANLLGEVGVTRLAAIGRMTAPEAGWHHDGRFNLLDLVTMTEIEHGAEIAAEAFAPYRD